MIWRFTILACLAAPSLAAWATSAATPGADASVVDYIHVDGFEDRIDCSEDLACSTPAPGRICLAGRVEDAGTTRPMQAFRLADRACADGAVGGACNLTLRVYDAIDLVSNPAAATPLPATIHVDGCARFRITNLPPPTFGFAAIVAEDSDPAPANDLHAPSAIFRAVSANAQVEDLALVVARRDTVERWTQTAGAPFGADSFADIGAILFTFRAAGAPAPGVTVLREGGMQPSLDWYFADPTPAARSQVTAAAASTGPNGSALLTGGTLSTYTGSGGEPAGCTWPSANAAAIPGYVVFVPVEC